MLLNNHSKIRQLLNQSPAVLWFNRRLIRPVLAFVKSSLYAGKHNSYAKRFLNTERLFTAVEIETVNRCNGKCSFCPVNALEPQRPYAKMSVELFRKIIDELAELEYEGILSIYSNNEPLLDQRIFDFYDYARLKCPKAYLSIVTNGTGLTVDKLLRLVKNCNRVVIDNYNDDLKINPNLEPIFQYVKEHGELNRIVQFAMRLEHEIITSRGGNAPNTSIDKVTKGICILPFCQMVIRPTGEVSLCCNDALGAYTMGDLNVESMMSVWKSRKYRDIRLEMYKNHRKNLKLCNRCDTMLPLDMFIPPKHSMRE